MKISLQQDYPASLSTLWRVFGNPDYPHRKYRALGITGYEIHRFDASADHIDLDMSRVIAIPEDRIPALVQRFLHPEHTLRYVSSWHLRSSTVADFDLSILPHALPVHITAKGSLTEQDAKHSHMSLDFDIKAHVPLLGGKIEKLIGQQLEKSFQSDHAFTLRYLAENA
ncbi:MAG TPA: DUF2505 domain-containing protein [Candidatus Kapabacteria bacterium]|nr:DUF2505 domain-containing protein [Candidatus Kapabacteria bacterium]